MDWAIGAAIKKTQQPPGSSRSIIESLNTFNNITDDRQSDINSILLNTELWLKSGMDEIKETKFNEKMKDVLVSPERTVAKFDYAETDKTKDLDDKISRPNNSDLQNNEAETPGRVNKEDLSNKTPISLKKFPRDSTTSKGDGDTMVRNEEQDKASPWSPYKVEKSLKLSSDADKTQNNSLISKEVESYITDKSAANTKVSESKPPRLHEEITVRDSPIKKIDDKPTNGDQTFERVKRRSNMFVPLPKKDPLIVKQASPGTAKIASTLQLPKRASQSKTVLSKSPDLRNRFVSKHSTKIARSPINSNSAIHSTTRTISSTASSSVFERLSTIPTKSFENKITAKHPSARHSRSSIDFSGSPIRRNASNLKQENGDSSMQETLRSIFSTRKDVRSPHKVTKLLNNHQDLVGNENPLNRDSNIQSTNELYSRKSLIPRLDRRQSNSTKTLLPIDKKLDEPTILHPATTNEFATKPVKASQIPSPFRGSVISTNSSSIEKKTIHKKTTLSPKQRQMPSLALSTKLNEKKPIMNNESPTDSKKEQKTKKDRLTKFQFVATTEPEKNDIKKKLNKRLSEVMRTQQEQERRRKELLRKKSQIDETSKRRSKSINDFKNMTGPTEYGRGIQNNISKSNISLDRKISHPPGETNSILYDLNTVDHRNIIGEASHQTPMLATETENGNQTLPDIMSDLDQEDTLTLADWAKAPYLQEQLMKQQNWDPKKIFGPVAPLNIDDIFNKTRFSKFKSHPTLSKKT